MTTDPANHYGFPRMVRPPNGDLLLFYRVGTTHCQDDAVIAMRRSSDEGVSWSHEQILWRPDTGCSAHNPVALVTESGRILLWVSRYEHGLNKRHPCYWSSSTDQGRTWAPFEVFDPAESHNCYYVTEAIRYSDGLLAGDGTFPASGIGNCHVRIWGSLDDGTVWETRSNLTAPDENDGDEIALAEPSPGQLLCILRDRHRKDLYRCWSEDNGQTWSERESIRDMLDCVLQRPFLTPLNDGTLLLTGRDYNRRTVVAYLSSDLGQTFGEQTVIDSYQEDGAYTTAVTLSEDRCLLAWYSDSHTVPLKPDIKSAVLRIRPVDG